MRIQTHHYLIRFESFWLTHKLFSVTLKLSISLSLVLLCAGIAGTSAARSLATPQQGVGSSAAVSINPKDYGAIGDCQSHTLSNTYHSLAAAQAVYPFTTSLS